MDTVETQEPPRPRGLNLPASVTNPTWGIGISGVIEDFTPGEAKLALETQISQGTAVTVQIRAFRFDGDILYCEPRGDRYEVHVSINDLDETGLRRTPRFPVNIPGVVFSPCVAVPTKATIVDLSGDGMGIELGIPLLTLSNVAIESESNVAFGIVRFSRELSPGLFRIGVQLHHIVQKQPSESVVRTNPSLMERMTGKFSFGKRSGK
jgi:hypothetical protein